MISHDENDTDGDFSQFVKSSSTPGSSRPSSSKSSTPFRQIPATDIKNIISDNASPGADSNLLGTDRAMQQRMERMRIAAERSMPSMDSMISSSRPMSARGPSSSVYALSQTRSISPNMDLFLGDGELGNANQKRKRGHSSADSTIDTISNSSMVHESVIPVHDDLASNSPHPPPLDLSDRKTFLMNPVPKEYGMLRCYVTRDKSSFANLFPKYHLFLEHHNTFLLAARKRKKNRSANYLLSYHPEDLQRASSNFFGKLRSNFFGTEFTIFDKGENPKNMSNSNKDVRLQLGGITYETNVLGFKGPRKLTVCIPKVTSEGEYFPFPQRKDIPTMLDDLKDKEWKNLLVYKNHPPQWNDDVKGYVLNFHGRVERPSVKNFQLAQVGGHNNEVQFQFGKVNDDKFTLDFRYPMSPYQAFCIALSSFDNKLACE